ncbi:MAG: hypothetical protein ACLSB9_04225 [Hydrogeniiclostridium mannosilyticum]
MLCVCCPRLLSRIHCRMHFTVLVSIALPVATLAVLKRKTGRGLLAALVAPVVSSAMRWCWSSCSTRRCSPVSGYYAVSGGLYGLRLPCAGLFEETGRLMGLSLLCKKTGIWRWA